VRIRTSGSELIVEGEPADVARAEKVLDQLATLMRGGYRSGKGRRQDRRATRCAGRQRRARRLFPPLGDQDVGQAAGRSEERHAEDVPRRDRAARHRASASARPARQDVPRRWRRPVSFLLAKRVSRIILARPAVEAGEKLGFLPGDLQEKVNPYLRPLYDALYDMIEMERAERLLERGTIEVAPIAFMRGRTLNDAFVILDEAQNTTSEQMKMFPDAARVRLEGGDHRGRLRILICRPVRTSGWSRQ
jgi:phosphate starvation-inducible PhoH-like protein